MSAEHAPISRGRRWFERWVFWPLALLLVALALELGFRAQRIVAGRPYLDAKAAWRVDQLADENEKLSTSRTAPAADSSSDSMFAHPYLGFVRRDFARGLTRAIEAMRARPDVVHVVVVGGQAAHAFVTSATEALSTELARRADRQGRRVVIWNLADAQYKAPQQLELVSYLTALGARPDVVIDISGRNEIQIGGANALMDTHPVYPARTNWEALVRRGAVDRTSLDLLVEVWNTSSEIESLVARMRSGWVHCGLWAEGAIERLEKLALDRDLALASFQRRAEASQRQIVLRGPTPPSETQTITNVCVSVWYQATFDLSSVCAARDIEFVSVIEPFGAGGRRDEASNGRRSEAKLTTGRRGLVQAATQLTKRGVTCIDAAALAPEPLSPRDTALAVATEIGRVLRKD
ncbi:MAG: hypothetical protein L6Q99_22400 [Planctomycetes bacterium]|nr:hypothetical protein [Planctomycetota bacterium]